MGSGGQQSFLGVFQSAHELRQESNGAGYGAQSLCADLQLPEGQLASVQSLVDPGVDVATDQAASRDREHAEQGDVAVGRSEAEVGVVEDAQRAEDPEHHVETKPADGRSQESQPADVLACRIQKKQQHQAAADDAQGVPDAPLRGDVPFGWQVPTQVQENDCRDEEEARWCKPPLLVRCGLSRCFGPGRGDWCRRASVRG